MRCIRCTGKTGWAATWRRVCIPTLKPPANLLVFHQTSTQKRYTSSTMPKLRMIQQHRVRSQSVNGVSRCNTAAQFSGQKTLRAVRQQNHQCHRAQIQPGVSFFHILLVWRYTLPAVSAPGFSRSGALSAGGTPVMTGPLALRFGACWYSAPSDRHSTNAAVPLASAGAMSRKSGTAGISAMHGQ